MDVFVTGGTGAIGREAVQALVAARHRVRALARSDDKARWLSDHGAEPVKVSMFDEDALAAVFDGCQAVANLASALPTTSQFVLPWAWRRNHRVRVDGSRAVTNAAIAAGVDVLVQESVAMVYPDCGTAWITEDIPADRFPIAEANLAAEDNAARFTAAGRTGVVLRFGWFYGPGAAHAEEFFALARRGLCVSMGLDDSYVSSIHVADGGRAVAAALGAPPGIYNVVDDTPLTKRQYADALAHAAGRPARLRAPGRAARLLGDKTLGLRRSLRVSNQRFREATGWQPQYPSAQEGWLETAAILNPSD
ncbi:MAG: NAD(P)-dependent oxidoreductase [Microthrixaceae bacterium]|nr:NAD(P)-dependent oxidoreductase [Microthrixaceae bacterium]